MENQPTTASPDYGAFILAKCELARDLYSLEGVGPVTRQQRQLVHDLCDGISHLLNINAGHREMIAELRAKVSA